jgi:hypothetical protein
VGEPRSDTLLVLVSYLSLMVFLVCWGGSLATLHLPVVRIRNANDAEWINVQTGEVDGKLIEVFGDLQDGDDVVVRGTDELRPGTRVTAKAVSAGSSGPQE